MPVLKFTNMIIPSPPPKADEIPTWLSGFMVELKNFQDRVAGAISLFVDGDIEVLKLTEQTVEPIDVDGNIPDGMIAYADGTVWNPGGTGEGFYGRIAGAWVKFT